MKRRFLLLFAAILAAVSLMAACGTTGEKTAGKAKETESKEAKDTEGNHTKYPLEIEIRDFEGNKYTQTFEKAPERVVTNNLSSIEMLLQLGLKDKIVGITKPDNAVTGQFADDVADLKNLGDKMTMSKEIIVGETPDLVVGRSMVFTDDSMGSVSTFNDLGINVFTQSASNIGENPPLTAVIDDVLTLGKIFDVNDRAEEYAKELQDRYDAIVEKVDTKKGEKKLSLLPIVGYDSSKSTFSIFGVSEGLQKDLLTKLNLVPAVEGNGADPSLETIISSNPDVIVYIKADRNAALDANAVKSILNEPLLKDVSAIKEGRVYEVTYDDFMDYGVRIFDTLEMLGNNIYGK
ncbi:ABC transporter substrate-binding protein [Niallia sp. NCCP-28]|uniref:ABC transporter substrate-binding protein n=1 Tax=Niallia sp. NCCP-28 TaxID=2934712 RepID=UPI0020824F83|nr:ABC transporter substrate-binding protein [Niallia sp. NCCP-28]GKU83979.1 metal ABC transporter substrate-binding protein [Niallia sp. NCCP-28]